MEKERSIKVILVMILLLLVVGITVAFAVLSTQLQINGTATIEPAKWEVKFENLVKASEVGDASETVAPAIVGDTKIEDFKVVLTKPGDSITYTFDVFNNGSLDAELGTLSKATIPTFKGLAENETDKTDDEAIVAGNFSYTLKYTDGGETVTTNDLLSSGARRNMTLTLAYSGDSLPTDDVEISDLGITLIYVQK